MKLSSNVLIAVLSILPSSVEGVPELICQLLPVVCGGGVPGPSPAGTCEGSNPNPTSDTNSQFDFDFAFDGVPTDDQSMFTDAAARWRQVIIGDVSDVTISSGSSECGSWPNKVDDLHICKYQCYHCIGRSFDCCTHPFCLFAGAVYDNIDGEGSILGYAGPRLYRSSDDAPIPATGQVSTYNCF